MPWSVCGLVFYYYVTNYNKFSGLKQYLCVSSQFLYVRSLSELNWVLCVWSHKTEIKVSETLGFYLAVIGRNSFPISFRLLVDFLSFLQLQDWRSVFSCWLSAGVCSLLLATILWSLFCRAAMMCWGFWVSDFLFCHQPEKHSTFKVSGG